MRNMAPVWRDSQLVNRPALVQAISQLPVLLG
jgi:hypothetical protein